MCARCGDGSGTCRTDWRSDSRGDASVLETVCTGREATLVTWWQTFDDDDDGARRARLLASVGCAALADRPLESCSLGERQRVLIARALYGGHELLLFDEPAAGLDLPCARAAGRGRW